MHESYEGIGYDTATRVVVLSSLDAYGKAPLHPTYLLDQ
jgi:hypothetical protein